MRRKFKQGQVYYIPYWFESVWSVFTIQYDHKRDKDKDVFETISGCEKFISNCLNNDSVTNNSVKNKINKPDATGHV